MKAPNHQPLPSPASGPRPLLGGTGHRPVAAGDPPAARACAGNATTTAKVFCAETRRQVAAENGQVGRSTQPEFARAHCDRNTASPVPATSSRRVAGGLLGAAPALDAFRTATASRRHEAQRYRVCSPSPFAEHGAKVTGLSAGALAKAEGRMRGLGALGFLASLPGFQTGVSVGRLEP